MSFRGNDGYQIDLASPQIYEITTTQWPRVLKMSLVSIAMATFNGARYLNEQLESFCSQTRLPDELIVRDDGSEDDTLNILHAFSRRAPFSVRIFAGDRRLGFADNFLTAAATCRGDYIMFSDQDDVWLPDKIKMGLSAISLQSSCLSMHTSIITDSRLAKLSMGKQGITKSKCFEHGEINPHDNGWGHQMMFERRLLKIVDPSKRPLDPKGRPLPHDIWIYVIASAVGRVSHIDRPLCLYRQHDSNTDGASSASLKDRLRAFFQVPLDRYRYRSDFCESMSAILNERACGVFCSQERNMLKKSSRLYDLRRNSNISRISLYQDPSLFSRGKKFLTTSRLDDREKPRDIPSFILGNAKDFCLGVLGLGLPYQTQNT